MIKISKQNNSLIVEGIENAFYINNGDNSYPLNSLIVVTDKSDMATFRSVATNDVLFSGLINNITINGEVVTKDNIIQKFDAVSNSSTGGGTVDAYTKEEADNKFASKEELTNVQTVANDADTKVDALTPRVEGVETAMGNKQDTLVSGENIKTINTESILGTGDIQINAGAKLVQMGTPAPFNELDNLLRNAVSALNNGTDYTDTFMSMNETISKQYFDLFKSLKNGDLLSTYDVITGNIFRVECNPFSFKHSGSTNSTDIRIKYLGDFSAGSPKFINYTRDIYVHYYFYESSGEIGQVDLKVYTKKAGPTLQKNDFKTINGESVIGEGNLEVSGVSEEQAQEIAKIPTLETSLGNKQDTLVSGTNIKTINSQSILGSGDLAISGVSEEQAQEIAKIPTIETELAQKANVSDVPTVQTSSAGTDKNYVYSERDGLNYKGVMSKLEVYTNNAEKVTLAYNLWGSGARYLVNLPNATTSKAGIITAADKTKLDSIPETIPSQSEIDGIAANVSTLETSMGNKQDILVSGTNIKTINNQSILGEGNLEITGGDVDLTNYYTKTETDTKLDAKQNTLVSGTNIKTINSQSILGEGNIEVTIPDATTATSGAMSAADKTKLDSMLNEWTGTQSEYDALTTKDNNTIYYVTE